MPLLSRIKAAFTAARWLQSSMRIISGGGEAARQPFSYEAAIRSNRSWIYAAASLNAYAVASQPLRLYVRNRGNAVKLWDTRRVSRKARARLAGATEDQPSRFVMQKAAEFGDDYEVVTEGHPILTLLDQVNPYQNGYEATVLRILYQELTGNAYIHPVIDERTGVPVELWTMPSQFVEIVPGKEQFIDAYLYGASRDQRRIFAPDEVIHFKRPNPGDLYYGLGKLEAAWGVANMNAAMKEMDLSFFENKARPDYLLTIKSNASQEEIERLEVQIDEKLRGKSRTGRFLTATADIDLKPMNFPPKDLGGRDDIVEEIAAVFGVPVSMLKANDPNLASATVGFQSWKSISVLPLLRLDEQVLNAQLLPLFGIEDDAFLAYDSPVIEDEKFAFEKRRSSVAGGILTANEARMAEGLEVVADPMADRLLINGQPLGGPAPAASPVAIGARPQETTAATSTPPSGETIADTALNGAQVTSLVDLATAVGAGQLPKDTALAIAASAFPAITSEQIRAMFDPIAISERPPAAGGASKNSRQDAALTFGTATDTESKAIDRKDALGDCVSEKIPKLIEEGYDRDQAVAIAYSMCQGKSLEDALAALPMEPATKALSDIDTRPPQTVADNARRALEVRARKPESQRGMTAVGIARARDLANRVALSEDTIRRMLAYFERHEVDKQGETWDEQGKGWQAWNGWGGDDGFAWARRKVEQFDRERERKAARKSCGCCSKNGGGDPPAKPAERKSVSQKALWSAVYTKASDRDVEREYDDITEKEDAIGRAVSKVLEKQVAEVIATIRKEGRPTAQTVARVEKLLRESRWNAQLVNALRPYLSDALTQGVNLGLDTVGKAVAASGAGGSDPDDPFGRIIDDPFNVARDDLRAYAQSESVRLARTAASGVNRYTSVRVGEILGDGIADGETIDQLSDRVQNWAGEKGDAQRSTRLRAVTIARTEAQRATRTAELEAWKSTGIVEGKTWLLAPDPCEFCEAASKAFEKDAVGLDQPFYQKGETLTGADGGELALDYEAIDSPPLHPNCRCSMIPKLAGEYGEIQQQLDADVEAYFEQLDKGTA